MAKGRMLNKTISRSHPIASLSTAAQVLFLMLVPHYDDWGKQDGNPYTIKGTVVPLIEYFDIPLIENCLAEISIRTDVKWFVAPDGMQYLHSLNWDDHQSLRKDRIQADILPSHPDAKIVTNTSAQANANQLPTNCQPIAGHEVEDQVEDQDQAKTHGDADRKIHGESRASASADKPPPSQKFSRTDKAPLRCPLPDNWAPDDALMRRGQEKYPALDHIAETARFCLHYQSTGVKRANWDATWLKWLDTATSFSKGFKPPGPAVKQTDRQRFERLRASPYLYNNGCTYHTSQCKFFVDEGAGYRISLPGGHPQAISNFNPTDRRQQWEIEDEKRQTE